MITSISAIRTARDTMPPTGTGSTTGTTGTTGSTTGTDSTSGSTSSDGSDAITNAAGGAMGKDQFVKLLVTEMQNQDPLNPMDGKDLAVQLAQFSSVEQLMNVNTKLDDLTAAVKAQQGSTTVDPTGSATTGATTGATTSTGTTGTTATS